MNLLQNFLCSLFFLLFATSLSAQGTPATIPNPPDANAKALVVNGNTAPNAVVQINGRAYADVLALSQLTGATVSVQPNRLILTIPVNPAAAPAAQGPQGFSKDFARAAISYLADLREWRSAIVTAIKFGAPPNPSLTSWLQENRSRSEESLRLAAVSASTPADKNALQLLHNEFSTIQQWDSATAAARQNLDASQTVDPDALQNDPLLTKLTGCGRSLATMITSGTFSDIAVCH